MLIICEHRVFVIFLVTSPEASQIYYSNIMRLDRAWSSSIQSCHVNTLAT